MSGSFIRMLKGGSEMSEYFDLKPGEVQERNLVDDPTLKALALSAAARQEKNLTGSSSDEWDAPIDLRVMRPRAVDLRRYWQLTKQPIPATIEATLGPRIPVLINHVITPFAIDGRPPVKVWGLGYEFIMEGSDSNTVSVLPNDEVLKIADIAQRVEFGLDVGGGVGLPDKALEVFDAVPALSLTGAELRASSSQRYSLSLKIDVSLRKVTGGPSGSGGALWKMYRQDERLDRPHTLVHTLLVPAGKSSINCTVRTWATQAGWLGSWGQRFWTYEDKQFTISLDGLA